MVTVEERMTILETEFRTELRHLATKADLAQLETKLETKLAQLETKLVAMEAKLLRWFVGLMLGSVVGASSIAYAAVRLFG